MFLHRFAFHRESFWTNILRKKKEYCTDLQRYVSPMKDTGEKYLESEYLKDRLKSYLNLKRAVASDI